jgi:TPR repeat protein
MHKHGQGVFQDEEKAEHYFRVAVSYECKRAEYEL